MEEEDTCIHDGPFNNSRNDSAWSCFLDDPSATISFENVVKVVVPTIFGVIAVLGLSGNLLVVIVVVSSRQMRNTTNVLIVNLALADLIFIVVCVPFTAIGYATPVWPFGNAWCKIYQYVIHVTVYASVYTLVLMSLDRYLAVVHPIQSLTLRTVRNASLIAGLAWVLILSLNYPVLVEHQAIEYRFYGQLRSACMNALIYQDENEEFDAQKSEDYRARIYYACFFAFAFVVPLTIVSVLYGLMVKRLLKGVVPGRSKSAESMRNKRRVTRLVVVVVIIFALCWLPLQMILVIQFVGNYTDHDSSFTVVKIASNCLAYMNSCVNPMLYAFLSDNFRKSFRHVIYSCCGLCRGDSRVESAESRGHFLNNDDRLNRSGSRNQLTRSIALNDLSTTRIESRSCLLEMREGEIYGTCSAAVGNSNLLTVPSQHQ